MASLHSSHFFSASSHLHISSKIHHRSLFSSASQHGLSQQSKECNFSFGGPKPYGALQNSKPKSSYPLKIVAGHSSEPRKEKLDRLMSKARKLWDSSPQPVKNFPWKRAFGNFIEYTSDIVLEIIKYLSVPLLFVTSLSEMSYCAHERKLKLITFPLIFGIVVAGVMRQTALDIAPSLKDSEVPWHLILMAIFFTVLKLPGPYYPYWGRIFIPHFANGALYTTLFFAIFRSFKPKQTPGSTLVKDLEDKSLDFTE